MRILRQLINYEIAGDELGRPYYSVGVTNDKVRLTFGSEGGALGSTAIELMLDEEDARHLVERLEARLRKIADERHKATMAIDVTGEPKHRNKHRE